MSAEEQIMEAVFKVIAAHVALGCELFAIILLGVGALEAAWGLVRHPSRSGDFQSIKAVWLRFAARIMLALELALAADIVRTAIAPTWSDIGQLAAIATIRTVLNYFLERDVETFNRRQGEIIDQKTAASAAGTP
jgi:uncharacterized membrane protein